MSYELVYGPLKTGAAVGNLPFTAVAYTDVLNAPGSMRATVPLVLDRTLPLSGQVQPPELSPDTLREGSTALYLLRDGVVLAGVVLWTVTANVEGGTLDLAGEGWLSYLRRRTIRQTLSYNADQHLIATSLVAYSEQFGRGINIATTAVPMSGVVRQRTYLAHERKNLGEALEQLAAVRGGFDIAFDTVRPGSNVFTKRLHCRDPRGRRVAHVFELGVNVDLLDYTGDGTGLANVVDAVGSGEGQDQLIATASDAVSLDTWPQLDEVISHGDVTIFATLQDHAARRLQRGVRPRKAVRLQVHADAVPVFGSYRVGDVVLVRGRHGYVQLVDEVMRIVQLSLDVSDQGEIVTLDLVDQGVFTG